MNAVVRPAKDVHGVFTVPADKSISQRAVIFASIAKGKSHIKNLLDSDDVNSAISVMKSLGSDIQKDGQNLVITGRGLHGIEQPFGILDAGNSGTAFRIISGILAGQSFYSTITGDDSLKRRPMKRIVQPLRKMGAQIWGREGDRFAPLSFNKSQIKGISYTLPVPSAQVKTCILCAGLYADGPTTVIEPVPCRDHTERMFGKMGANIELNQGKIRLFPGTELTPLNMTVPGDISSAAYLIAAGLIVAGSKITIENVGLNPTRTGVIEVLKRMGAKIKVDNICEGGAGEPVGDVTVETSALTGVEVTAAEAPLLIDELPLMGVLGALAKGATTVRGAAELRVKETDRIAVMGRNLQNMGVNVTLFDDGFSVEGPQKFVGGDIDPAGDHRMAMTFAVAGLVAEGETVVENPGVVNVSYPGFWSLPLFDSKEVIR